MHVEQTRNSPKKFLSIREFATATGLSEKTIRRRIADATLPSFQPGGPGTRVLIPISVLDPIGLGIETGAAAFSSTTPGDVASRAGGRIPGPEAAWLQEARMYQPQGASLATSKEA